MTVYLSSPRNQMQAGHLDRMPVLLSFATWSPWITSYLPTFKQVLIDSGAYSAHASGTKIDGLEYLEWSHQFRWADAVAGLDDISGDWKKSLRNYRLGGFPTFHDSDPPELLDDLVELARERGNWLGIGLVPTHGMCSRRGRERWIRDTLDRIPEDIHVHGWALRAYSHLPRINSMDSTNWFRDALDLTAKFSWLTPSECTELVVKRYQRQGRYLDDPEDTQHRLTL